MLLMIIIFFVVEVIWSMVKKPKDSSLRPEVVKNGYARF